jgi:hypothetical protein
MRSAPFTALAGAFLLSVVCARPVVACPNCKEAVAAQPADVAKMARGYNWSILLFLATPLALLSTGAFLVHRAARRGLLPEL